MRERFENHNIDSPRLISEMLMSHVLGGQRIDLYADVDRIASKEELVSLRSFVKRTLDNEPVQFIVGKVWFFGAEFNSFTIPCGVSCPSITFEDTRIEVA